MARRSHRSLHKLWKNKTPVGFTRRVRWFEGNNSDIRLNLQDEWREVNLFYTDHDIAQIDYEFFIQKCEELEKVMPAWVKGHVNTDMQFYRMSPVNLTTDEYEIRLM